MIANKVRTNVYIDGEIKEQAKQIFKEYGVSLSDAINIFLKQSVLERGLPFEMKLPNTTTKQAIKEANEGIGEHIDFDAFVNESKPNA